MTLRLCLAILQSTDMPDDITAEVTYEGLVKTYAKIKSIPIRVMKKLERLQPVAITLMEM
ncbi:hypothetical protein [Microbacter margulisiae]|uniref:Uncharacterized protein n=1 Tax=Microbacter margulisiae TaxID=1350067 RepID=A0A7W5DSI1_9PORP|nr:hypothetical protein [Microbacter margulisiae]MBB3188264.1 hypothetical protein [Microbacter margulisiae]